MTIDLDELERLEKAATKGPWTHEVFSDEEHEVVSAPYKLARIFSDPTSATGDNAALIVALRNAAAPMIQELRELRASRVPPEREELLLAAMDAATARAERDALRAELKEIKDDKSWNDGVIFALRAEVEGLKGVLAIIHRDGGHHTEAVGLTQSVNDAHKVWAQLMTDLEAARAQLATAREAIRATVDLLESSRKAHSKGSPEYDALFIRCEVGGVLEDALKETTKGGGA